MATTQHLARKVPGPHIRLVLFDAFDTLARPRKPPHVQYADEARAHGLRWGTSSSASHREEEENEAIGRAFKQAFKQTLAQHPRYGLTTGLPNPAAWWSLLIERTFQPLLPPSQPIPPALTPALLTRFASNKAYDLFDDVHPALSALRENGLALGLATNSDAAIVQALSQLGLERYMNLSLLPPSPSLSPSGDESSRSPPPPTLSYTAPADKPDAAFFAYALARAQIHTPQEVLYVGDQLHEDYWGARDAGLRALWLRRRRPQDGSVMVSNQPVSRGANKVGRDERGAEQGEEVRTLIEVVEYISRVNAEAASG